MYFTILKSTGGLLQDSFLILTAEISTFFFSISSFRILYSPLIFSICSFFFVKKVILIILKATLKKYLPILYFLICTNLSFLSIYGFFPLALNFVLEIRCQQLQETFPLFLRQFSCFALLFPILYFEPEARI